MQQRAIRRRGTSKLVVQAGFAEVAPVLVLSAIPFLGVQALAESGLGKKLQVCTRLQLAI